MSIALRQQLFLAVRDIPYKLDSRQNDSCCVSKTKLLGELLTRIGLQCQVWRSVFRWDETGMPPELVAIAPRPICNHIFLKVYIPEQQVWRIVDPTWDKGLNSFLPINEWDGLSDTQLAYPGASLEFVSSVEELDYRNFDVTDLFTKKLNNWYSSCRKDKYV
jgi:hypothetical protein